MRQKSLRIECGLAALAIKVASLVVILAVRYKTAVQEMASVRLESTVGLIFASSMVIWLRQ